MGLIQQEPAVQKSTGTAAAYTSLYFWSVSIRSLFVSPLFVILIIAKADSTDIKSHRKRGDFSSPQLCRSVSILIFFSLHSFIFLFSSGLGWNVHLPYKTFMALCLLNHLLVGFDMMSSLLTWRHSWKSGAMKVGSQVLPNRVISALISVPSSILALCQHAVQENMFFHPLILLGMHWRKMAYPQKLRGKEAPGFDCEKKGASLFHKQVKKRNKKELGPQLLSSY